MSDLVIIDRTKRVGKQPLQRATRVLCEQKWILPNAEVTNRGQGQRKGQITYQYLYFIFVS